MKILVTGSTGLVGTAIQRVASTHYKDREMIYTSSKDCNLLDYDSTCELINKHSPDWVLHLAANVGGLYKNMNCKVQMYEDNMNMNMNVIRACYNNGVKNLAGMLSTCIFPDETTYPIDESMLDNGPPHTSNDAYAYAKRMFKVQCDAYNEQYNTNYNCIIPANIYGPNDNYDLQDAHVIPALIHKCYISTQAKTKFKVLGTGKPLRQFIYSDDLADIILKILPGLERDSIIITNPREYSIADAAKYIATAFNYEHDLQFDPTASDGQYRKQACIDKLWRFHLNEQYDFTDLQSGISETVKHFIKNYNNLRTGVVEPVKSIANVNYPPWDWTEEPME